MYCARNIGNERMRSSTLILLVLVLVVPVLLTQVRVSAKLPCVRTADLVVEEVNASVSLVHCKGTEFNVTVRLWNRGSTPYDGYIRVDGWDTLLNVHVTEATVRIKLEPGERRAIWEMLPVDTQEPSLQRYVFNVTVIGGSPQSNCGEEPIPLYIYLMRLLKG